MHVMVNRLSIWYLLSQIIVSSIIGLYNFLIYRFVIFKAYDTSCFQKTTSGIGTID
jgi:hypothetical protein